MQLNLISLDTVKSQLGITGTDQDASISAMIPIVSSDVRRILNCQFDNYISATYASGSDQLDTYAPSDAYQYNKVDGDTLKMGQVVTGENIPDDTYIQSQDANTGVYTISADTTGAGVFIYPTLTISQWPTVSKMILYRINQQNSTNTGENWKSKSYGPVNVSKADGEVNKQWNYPQTLIDDLGIPFAEVG